jgi:hypothetical protein
MANKKRRRKSRHRAAVEYARQTAKLLVTMTEYATSGNEEMQQCMYEEFCRQIQMVEKQETRDHLQKLLDEARSELSSLRRSEKSPSEDTDHSDASASGTAAVNEEEKYNGGDAGEVMQEKLDSNANDPLKDVPNDEAAVKPGEGPVQNQSTGQNEGNGEYSPYGAPKGTKKYEIDMLILKGQHTRGQIADLTRTHKDTVRKRISALRSEHNLLETSFGVIYDPSYDSNRPHQ